MRSSTKGTVRGRSVDLDEPEWQPLIDLVAGDWMCMFAVDLEDGRRVYAYKHTWTRRYVHVTAEGDAFVYVHPGRYRQVDPFGLLYTALDAESGPWRPLCAEDH